MQKNSTHLLNCKNFCCLIWICRKKGKLSVRVQNLHCSLKWHLFEVLNGDAQQCTTMHNGTTVDNGTTVHNDIQRYTTTQQCTARTTVAIKTGVGNRHDTCHLQHLGETEGPDQSFSIWLNQSKSELKRVKVVCKQNPILAPSNIWMDWDYDWMIIYEW